MPKIKALTARSFRGIREATLELNGRSLVLLGENGTGKSSFVDALEYLYAGKVSHLEGTQGLSTTRHAPHIQKTPEPTLVEIEFQEPEGKASRVFGGLAKVPANLKDHIALGARGAFILRRKNLLDFILAQPATRYEQLAAIIGISDLGRTERALAQAKDEVSAQCDLLDRQIRAEEDKLRDLMGETPRNRQSLLAALNRKLVALGELPLGFLDEMESRKIAVIARSRSPLDAASSLSERALL